MISSALDFVSASHLTLNFAAHLSIFVGALYTALHNRDMPNWVVTPMWYIGLISLFTSITIVCQWAIGPEFPLSYWSMGILGETALNISVAVVLIILMLKTIKADLENRHNRHK